ncbi:hypothetical protein HA402_009771 [Bradysia odoriphaga]|nr:hypothetical protein HA402_009771 [Bradysia odoriphaga]
MRNGCETTIDGEKRELCHIIVKIGLVDISRTMRRRFLLENVYWHTVEGCLNMLGLCVQLGQKDKLDDMQQSDVVYRIKCSICQSMYIGETCQRACTRKQQHKNSVSQTNLAKPKTASALALHTKTTGHAFDFDSMKILDRQRNKKKLQISEVNHIIMNREVACNYKQDTEHIAPAYSNILRQYASKRFPTRNAGA